MRLCLAVTAVLLLAGSGFGDDPPAGKLELRGFEASHGPFGPAREGSVYAPGDEVYVRCVAAGVRSDADNKVGLTTSWVVVRAGQKEPVTTGESKADAGLALGGGAAPIDVGVPLTEKYPPGEYTLTVAVEDRVAGAKASAAYKFTVKAGGFAAIQVRFSYDEGGRVPAPPGGTVGQTLHVRLKAVGFDKASGRVSVTMTVHVLDAAGKPARPPLAPATASSKDPEVVAAANVITMEGKYGLNRPGDFRVRVVVTDDVTKKTDTFECPLRVVGR